MVCHLCTVGVQPHVVVNAVDVNCQILESFGLIFACWQIVILLNHCASTALSYSCIFFSTVICHPIQSTFCKLDVFSDALDLSPMFQRTLLPCLLLKRTAVPCLLC